MLHTCYNYETRTQDNSLQTYHVQIKQNTYLLVLLNY